MQRLNKQLLVAAAAVTHLLLHNASGTALEHPAARGHGLSGTAGLAEAAAAMTQGMATSPQPRATSSAHTAPRGFFCAGQRCRPRGLFSPACRPQWCPGGNLPPPAPWRSPSSKDTEPTLQAALGSTRFPARYANKPLHGIGLKPLLLFSSTQTLFLPHTQPK